MDEAFLASLVVLDGEKIIADRKIVVEEESV
jgi:hypothetical protein